MDTKSKYIKNIELVERFRKILFFQLSVPLPLSIALLYFSFVLVKTFPVILFVIYLILVGLLIIATITFSFYTIYVLIKEKHHGWIATFFLMILLPIPVVYLIMKDNILLVPWLLSLIPPFYLYWFIIKYAVDEWLKEFYNEQQRFADKIEWEEKRKEWLI